MLTYHFCWTLLLFPSECTHTVRCPFGCVLWRSPLHRKRLIAMAAALLKLTVVLLLGTLHIHPNSSLNLPACSSLAHFFLLSFVWNFIAADNIASANDKDRGQEGSEFDFPIIYF